MADRRRSSLKIPDRRRFALAPWQCDNPHGRSSLLQVAPVAVMSGSSSASSGATPSSMCADCGAESTGPSSRRRASTLAKVSPGRLEDRLATGYLAPAADDHVAVGAVSRQCSQAQSSTRVDGRLLGLQRLARAEDRLGAGHNQRQRQHDDGSFPRVERLVHALVAWTPVGDALAKAEGLPVQMIDGIFYAPKARIAKASKHKKFGSRFRVRRCGSKLLAWNCSGRL